MRTHHGLSAPMWSIHMATFISTADAIRERKVVYTTTLERAKIPDAEYHSPCPLRHPHEPSGPWLGQDARPVTPFDGLVTNALDRPALHG